jgi:hypothetical protein
MTRDEMMSLSKGDLVTVKKTGKVYRCYCVDPAFSPERNAEIEAEMARQTAARGFYSGYLPGFTGSVTFIQQRNGEDYGPVRNLKPENIERVTASAPIPSGVYKDHGKLYRVVDGFPVLAADIDDGSHPADLSYEQRPVRG